MKDISRHPCFNIHARQRHGRVHLPVAPTCNIQCRFCNRKYDCANENRPGVTTTTLTPHEAVSYLQDLLKQMPEISVVGIAGPGDPFADPKPTLQTLRLVHEHFPEMLFCVATNGLNLAPHVEELACLGVSHVTVTINAIDPKVGANVYRWVRDHPRVLRGEAAASRMIDAQLTAITLLKDHGIVTKVNTIVLPGINDHHIEEIARKMAELKVDIMNCMPLFPAPGSELENAEEPSVEMMASTRKMAGKYLPQMTHCQRCRADAAGLLGGCQSAKTEELLQMHAGGSLRVGRAQKPNVAVATLEGLLVNQHLGGAREFCVYTKSADGPRHIDTRKAPVPGDGDQRWYDLAQILDDCHSILVEQAGEKPKKVLASLGTEVICMEGLAKPALEALFDGRPVPSHLTVQRSCTEGKGCGKNDTQSCSGGGEGCGA
ncbi:MAG: radical SAM protein [Chitinispirillaceae bacterium]